MIALPYFLTIFILLPINSSSFISRVLKLTHQKKMYIVRLCYWNAIIVFGIWAKKSKWVVSSVRAVGNGFTSALNISTWTGRKLDWTLVNVPYLGPSALVSDYLFKTYWYLHLAKGKYTNIYRMDKFWAFFHLLIK